MFVVDFRSVVYSVVYGRPVVIGLNWENDTSRQFEKIPDGLSVSDFFSFLK